MNPKDQLAAFELLGDLLGGVWKGAAITAQVLTALAFLADSSWWYVLYAALAAVVAKWLEHELLMSQRRVAQQLLEQSASVQKELSNATWAHARLEPLATPGGGHRIVARTA